MGHRNNKNEYKGTIIDVRDIEDCIRATKKYKEEFGTMRKKHPIQGEDFSSKVFCKYYEVYPDIEISWDMAYGVALDWLWGETSHIDVMFKYDYRVNKASVLIKDGTIAIEELNVGIPHFKNALDKVMNGAAR